jgi:hypothetical protein
MDLVDIAGKLLPKGHVYWLEVGAGDGRNLQFQLSILAANRTLHATAIEPADFQPPIAFPFEWVSSRVEDFESDRRFHWISVRHSAYYLDDPISEIRRLVGMLDGSGVLALTHWSRDCILRRLHVALCDNQGATGCEGIEDIAEFFRQDPRIEVAGLSFHDTDLDVIRVLTDAGLRHALYELACRGSPATVSAAADPSGTVERLLRSLPNSGRRQNGILLLRPRSV